MSHFSKVSAKINDLTALESAVRNMGYTMKQNARCRYYGGSQIKDFVIELPGSYDCAIVPDGENYVIEADFWGNHVGKFLGNNGDLLMQKYAAEKVKMEALLRGLGVFEQEKDGSINIQLTDSETGGTINIVCFPGGKTEIQTDGFQGEGCMKFRDIEEALGAIDDVKLTDDYYLPEEDNVERINCVSE